LALSSLAGATHVYEMKVAENDARRAEPLVRLRHLIIEGGSKWSSQQERPDLFDRLLER